MKSLLVGVYEDADKKSNCLTKFAKNLDQKVINEFESVNKSLDTYLKLNKTRAFYNLLDEYPIILFVGLGDKDAEFSRKDDLHYKLENIKKAIATGIKEIKKLTDNKVEEIIVDDCDGMHQLIGETVGLNGYSYKNYVDLNKTKNDQPTIQINKLQTSDEDEQLFKKGLTIAKFQNISRLLSETPANLMTPTRFAEFAKELANKNGVEIRVHDEDWAREKKMGSFLAVSQGSEQPLKFVELHYKHEDCKTGEIKPVVLVGKGITFDSGGISLKNRSGMDSQRADMTGSACVLSTICGLAKLKVKGHFIGLMPMCENMIGSNSVKPGDVVYAMNKKSIQINNTDAEGRLILADALSYADEFDPEIVIDIATLTGAARTAIGQCASAVFSTDDDLFNELRKSGQYVGDRVWRFPLYTDYLRKTSNSILADMVNQSKDTSFGASHCVAAAFLSQFTKCEKWMHLDIAPTKVVTSDCGYMEKGMSGGSVRTLLNLLERLSP